MQSFIKFKWSIATSLFLTSLGMQTAAYANSLKINRDVFDQVGNELAYFEHKFGPAKRVDFLDTRIYQIGDCEFNISLDKNKSIKSVELKISKRCDVNAKFKDNSIVSKMTLKDFYNSSDGKFGRTCLYLCGNAYDPTLYYLAREPHALQFLERIIETKVPDGLSEAVLKTEGEDKLRDMSYDVTIYHDITKRIAANSKIISYTEGNNLETDWRMKQ